MSTAPIRSAAATKALVAATVSDPPTMTRPVMRAKVLRGKFAIQTDERSVNTPLLVVAICFAAFSISGPLHTQLGAILGDRTSGQLQSELVAACSTPAGIAHLERPGLAAELVAARDFDLGIMGPPISVSMGFVGGGLVLLLGGAAQAVALATVTWWGAIVLAGEQKD